MAVIIAPVADREICIGCSPCRIRKYSRSTSDEEIRSGDGYVRWQFRVISPKKPNANSFVPCAGHDKVAAALGIQAATV